MVWDCGLSKTLTEGFQHFSLFCGDPDVVGDKHVVLSNNNLDGVGGYALGEATGDRGFVTLRPFYVLVALMGEAAGCPPVNGIPTLDVVDEE